ncbi:MAG: dethiobiotin synthase [Pseudomonadota bacterium]|nr:dethiobiotin synthase [Pseudomonadota bacterium]|tara:strand:- start:317 stop:955 length:639 start_codon:yes stop_codon:yes gene_type:complete
MKNYFVTGTDTGCGKTVVSSCLVKALDADYWKPIQTGTIDGSIDKLIVQRLTGFEEDRFHPSSYSFRQPLSPLEAASREKRKIIIEKIKIPQSDRPIIIEGAGGILVPITRKKFMVDLIARLHLSVVLVCKTSLGTINHTLLSVEALRKRHINLVGIVFSGKINKWVARTIAEMTKVNIIGKVPIIKPLSRNGVESFIKNDNFANFLKSDNI